MSWKPLIPRDESYLAFVRRHECCVHHCRRPSIAHHALGRCGTAVKGSDFGAVPLCTTHHGEVHTMGEDTFQRVYDVDFKEVALNLMHYERTGEPLTMVLE